MSIIKITPEMAKKFKSLREQSKYPEFKISSYGEVVHGCKVIEETDNAVFVHCSGFLDCFAFWMKKEAYKTLKDGYILGKKYITDERGLKVEVGQDLHYNGNVYRY